MMTEREMLEYMDKSEDVVVDETVMGWINTLVKAKREDIRADLAKILVSYEGECVEQALLKLATDKKYSVRLEAIDSLSNFPSDSTYQTLMQYAEDKDWLTRGYALWGICKTCLGERKVETIQYIKNVLEIETSKFCRINMYGGMCILGEKENILNLLSLYPNSYYRNKCSIFNTLHELLLEMESTYRTEIELFCEEIQLEMENEPISVQSSFNRLRDLLK
ncbi:MAG: HEAT repeat domain-containing protein [Firmicutes bacterium]|nr:HEAT repeat domain-containing protein [Bacillota bacterium]